jgi:di/tricarboxylate transporter
MNADQILLFTILGVVMAMLVWGRLRYDLVAFAALLVAVIAGVVPSAEAFSGFGHPATIVIAMVLVVSRGLSNAGVVDLLARAVSGWARSLTSHVMLMAGLAGSLSTVMNNVGALALLMPVDLKAARKAKRSPSLTLMSLSFASILGGLVTLIGTPPNIIIAAYREQAVGEPYSMFDFAPVGGVTALAGILFVALVGWRLLPKDRSGATDAKGFQLEGYLSEARVSAGSPAIDKKVRELDDLAAEHEIDIVGLVRRGKRLPGMARHSVVREGDVLVIEGGPEDIADAMRALQLEHAVISKDKTTLLSSEDVLVAEVVVPQGANIAGRSAASVRLKHRRGVHLLGISRSGRRFRDRLRHVKIRAGDVLLLQGNANELPEVVQWLGCLPLAERGVKAGQQRSALIAGGLFAGAIAAASVGLIALPVALSATAAVMILARIVPLREVYTSIEWPVIVLIASMIPIGAALESTGCTQLIVDGLLSVTEGYSAVAVLVLLMVVTMTLSDVMNNTATAVVVAPIAVAVATRLDASPDPFLMGVAVAASCAFLTPIGHKNNTLILGPGGYHFGDYWRMGVPLELIVLAVSVPMILWAWPLSG